MNPEDYESFGGSKLLIEKYSSDESDEEGLEDLDGVPVPSGVAPDTQGQIYKALTQLTVVKNIGWVKEQRKLAKSKHEKVPTSQPQPASEIPKHFPGMPWSQTEHRVETTTIKSSIDAAKLALYASSSAVVAAAPQLRDLVKEAVVMVPASVQRRRIEREANQ